MAKMTLKVKVNDTYFQCQPRKSHDACLVENYVIPAQSVTSYRADKVHLGTDGRTDGQYPLGLKGQGVNKIIGIIFIFISIITSCIFNWKQIQVESLKYQLAPWLMICTPFNG